ILVMNFTGLIPGFKPGTSSLSITLGLAIVAFIAVQYYGFRTHGIRYLLHFLGPVPALALLIAPLELLSEVIRVASLSIRLYGNIYGEEQVITALATKFSPLIAVLMLPLQALTIILQAFVFTLLVTIYIALATEKHEEGHEEAEAHA
ncbi:MAG TPA: F0F1 ATP synthase subunit A, partial [Armatimonadota bacterium]